MSLINNFDRQTDHPNNAKSGQLIKKNMYRARTEFVLHIEHFRNVDLFQQGIYFLKFQIFNEDDEKVYYANPYHFETRGDVDNND